MGTCKIEGCGGRIHVKSAALCSRHYNRLRATGSVEDGPRARKSFKVRFWEKVDKRSPDDCWPWVGKSQVKGYGYIGRGGRGGGKMLSNRAAWLLTYGELPDDMVVRHTCHNRKCCNPAHLELGSQGDNVRDMWGRESGAPKGNTKLTDRQVIAIIHSNQSNAALAEAYGVHYSHIWSIKKGRSWSWLQNGRK